MNTFMETLNDHGIESHVRLQLRIIQDDKSSDAKPKNQSITVDLYCGGGWMGAEFPWILESLENCEKDQFSSHGKHIGMSCICMFSPI